ncbi:MAG: hypothetical protein FWD31_06610 [Planctomycetaceae bacterium]|nr:hypothetical protein [Planctomycetaceae bacterium]
MENLLDQMICTKKTYQPVNRKNPQDCINDSHRMPIVTIVPVITSILCEAKDWVCEGRAKVITHVNGNALLPQKTQQSTSWWGK